LPNVKTAITVDDHPIAVVKFCHADDRFAPELMKPNGIENLARWGGKAPPEGRLGGSGANVGRTLTGFIGRIKAHMKGLGPGKTWEGVVSPHRFKIGWEKCSVIRRKVFWTFQRQTPGH
jgi:hypothetical protein